MPFSIPPPLPKITPLTSLAGMSRPSPTFTAGTPIYVVNSPNAAAVQKANLKKSKIKHKKECKTRNGIPNYTAIEIGALLDIVGELLPLGSN